ncbi:hypothetical protein X753_31165 [Mesorhizobium sp. LNJC399B00]|nr:hypothetical protein X753_31165 [Mesorhizobium sp. LNJC399B00]
MALGRQFFPELAAVDQRSIQSVCQVAAGPRILVTWLNVAVIVDSVTLAMEMGDCNMGPKSGILFIVLNPQ